MKAGPAELRKDVDVYLKESFSLWHYMSKILSNIHCINLIYVVGRLFHQRSVIGVKWQMDVTTLSIFSLNVMTLVPSTLPLTYST
jgi:hypothetical protein